MVKSIFFIATFFLLLFVGNLFATNYYVSTSGTGNASSWTNKRAYTIFAWTSLVGGDTVFFDGGADSLTYGKVTVSGLLANSQVIITKGKESQHNGKVIIQTSVSESPATSLLIENCRNVKVTGLTIKSETSNVVNGYTILFTKGMGSVLDPSNNVLDNCNVISYGNGNLIEFNGQTKDSIINCIMEVPDNNGISERDGISVGNGGGGHTIKGNSISIKNSDDATAHKDLIQFWGGEGLENNYETVIANNFLSYIATNSPAATSIMMLYGMHKNRFLIYNNVMVIRNPVQNITSINVVPESPYTVSVKMYNNTIINGTYHGIATWFDNLDTLIFKNNIVISDSTGSSVLYTHSGFGYINYKDIDYNQYYMQWSSNPTFRIDTSSSGYATWAQWQGLYNTNGTHCDIHSSVSDANFINRWGTNVNDYKLLPGSPGTGTGADLSIFFTNDITGTVRPTGAGTWDKGAFQTSLNTSPNTYYISNSGNDNNPGTSSSSAWKTISKVNSTTFNPGDNILFRRGDTWTEILTPKGSGNSTSPIIYDAYGTGNLPVIDGGNVRANCISLIGINYITIKNIRTQYAAVNTTGNIHAQNTDHLRIENCNFYITSHGGVFIESSTNGYVGKNNMTSPVSNNNNQADGIYSQRNNNCIFENNSIIISDMGAAHNDGIQSYLDANMTIRNNYIFQNNTLTTAQGIDMSDGAGIFEVYNNVIKCPNSNSNIIGFNNNVSGTGVLRCYQNTVLGNVYCLRILKCADVIVENNIFYTTSATPIIDINTTLNTGSKIDYNLYYRSGSGSIVNYEPLGLKTYAQWQSLGFEAHGLNANPIVNDTLCPDASSPVINAGVNLGGVYSYDIYGVQRPLNQVDLGAYEVKSAPTPVELSSFSGIFINKTVQLKWTTATEINNQGFEIERNSEGSWIKLGFVQGKGNSVTKNDYTFVDETPVGDKIQYRLKQVDNNGNYKYYDAITVAGVPQDFFIGNYPNPFNPSTTIKYSIPSESIVNMAIYNIIGERIDELKNELQSSGTYEISWSGSNHPSGVYFLSIVESPVNGSARFSKTIKMNLIK